MAGYVAPDIFHLIEHLKATHQPGDLYRGQVRDYPVLVPSLFRGLLADLSTSSDFVPLVHLKFEDLLRTNVQARMKYRLMAGLIDEFGIGLGNILAQQYGLGSETIDVTENIDVAAYFATRRYPEYAHHDSPGQGVIYRFRGLESDNLADGFQLRDLNDHFEMGRNEDGYFDFFVQDADKSRVFGRDSWWDWQHKSSTSIVSTLRFVSNHKTLRSIAEHKARERLNRIVRFMDAYPNGFDWESTRFFAQDGGLIRPRIYWNSLIPSEYQLAENFAALHKIRSQDSFVKGPSFYGAHDRKDNPALQKMPLFVPSAAIKKELAGIENLRASSACEAFLFCHTEKRVTGFYRRDLWPEPSDDSFYGFFWWKSTPILFSEFDAKHTPAVNDPYTGVLDRGYFSISEKGFPDGRADEDLFNSLLADATENIRYGAPNVLAYINKMNALMELNAYQKAISAGIAGLRQFPDEPTILLMLATCLNTVDKPSWAEKAINRAFDRHPENDAVVYEKAISLANKGDFGGATILSIKAIEIVKKTQNITIHEFELLGLRCILACLSGDITLGKKLYDHLKESGYNVTQIFSEVDMLKTRFPFQCTAAVGREEIIGLDK